MGQISVPMEAHICVWVSCYERVRGKFGWSRRVKPSLHYGHVYTLDGTNVRAPFKGWSFEDLKAGKAAKWHGGAIYVADNMDDAYEFTMWFERVYAFWMGNHPGYCYGNRRVQQLTYTSAEPTGAEPADVDSVPFADNAYGDLAWAWVRGLKKSFNEPTLVLLDLSTLRGQPGNKYVDFIHVADDPDEVYANMGTYVSFITCVPNAHAREILARTNVVPPPKEAWDEKPTYEHCADNRPYGVAHSDWM